MTTKLEIMRQIKAVENSNLPTYDKTLTILQLQYSLLQEAHEKEKV
jgi:hypothetical protein